MIVVANGIMFVAGGGRGGAKGVVVMDNCSTWPVSSEVGVEG